MRYLLCGCLAATLWGCGAEADPSTELDEPIPATASQLPGRSPAPPPFESIDAPEPEPTPEEPEAPVAPSGPFTLRLSPNVGDLYVYDWTYELTSQEGDLTLEGEVEVEVEAIDGPNVTLYRDTTVPTILTTGIWEQDPDSAFETSPEGESFSVYDLRGRMVNEEGDNPLPLYETVLFPNGEVRLGDTWDSEDGATVTLTRVEMMEGRAVGKLVVDGPPMETARLTETQRTYWVEIDTGMIVRMEDRFADPSFGMESITTAELREIR